MTPDRSIGRILTLADAEAFWTQIHEAEKVLGPLSREERMVILEKFGSNITTEELVDLMKGKRVLIVKDKNEKV